ncbi:MAG TPA: hypothetical protein VFS00_18125 [Polyangiaceae bacterium]|nr:hypothetical protein [Polyangiaceae bacterium]
MRDISNSIRGLSWGIVAALGAAALGVVAAGCGDATDREGGGDPPAAGGRAAAAGASRLASGGACAHDQCTQGPPLDGQCGPAAESVCAVDPYCCQTYWDNLCVNEVASVANSLVCVASAGACGHTLCSDGPPLQAGCDAPPASSSCVASVCAVDPYCCNVAWDRLCVDEVTSACGKSCDARGCDLDGDGDPSPECGGSDGDDACHPPAEDDLQLTQCAGDLVGFAGSLIGAIGAIQTPLETRTTADMIACPADEGVGELYPHVNIFSHVGTLDRSCNRLFADDCNDPARSNYWVSVVDDRRPGTDPHAFRVIWGGDPVNYIHYGACYPDPNAFDNPAAGVPRLLRAVNDLDGDGALGDPASATHACGVQNHVFLLRFYVPDANGARDYVEKANMAHVSSPFLVPSWVPIPGLTAADRAALGTSAYVAVDITLNDPPGQIITALAEGNYDSVVPTWVQWKEPALCAAP